MSVIDRTLAPDSKAIENISLIHAQKEILKNGIPCYIINAGEEELVKIEWIFTNAAWDINKAVLAQAVPSLLTEGTKNYSAAELADKIDFYGAFIQHDAGFDQSGMSLYCLNKNLAQVLPLIREAIMEPAFSKKEVQTYIQNQQQKLAVNLEKNDYLSRKKLAELLFGAQHPYGYTVKKEDYANLSTGDLHAYHLATFHPGNCTIIMSGKVTVNEKELLLKYFGTSEWKSPNKLSAETTFPLATAKINKAVIEKKNAVQSAIRLGKLTIGKTRPDFPGLQVLNTILGGYFGSRLMTNIREDKGYTYGIGSGIASLKHGAYFYIATEVGTEVCSNAVNEIHKEIHRLRTELVPIEELELVRNYMLGSLMGSIENAFSHADKLKGVLFHGLGYDYYDRYTKTIRTISPEKLLELANTYLNENSLYTVIAGKE